MEKINLILDKLEEKFKKTFKFNIKEGMGDDGCYSGYSKSGKECKKNTNTVQVFLTYPLFLLVIMMLYVANYTSFIGFVKTFPLENITGAVRKCKVPDINKLFDEKSKLSEGILNIKEYLNFQEEYFYDRAWVGLGGKPNSKNKLMQPLYILFYYLSKLNITIAGFLKKKFFKNQWNTHDETKKINREEYLYGLIGLFLYFFYFVGMIIVYILYMVPAILIAGVQIATNIGAFFSAITNGKEKVGYPFGVHEIIIKIGHSLYEYRKELTGIYAGWIGFCHAVLFVICAFLFVGIGAIFSIFYSLAVAFTGFKHLFFKSFFNFYPKDDSIKYFGKSFLNVIWDYKYILALLTILLWIGEFHFYTKGDDNIFKFINYENRDMTTGLLAGICSILLIKQQLKYTSSIPKTEIKRTDIKCDPKN